MSGIQRALKNFLMAPVALVAMALGALGALGGIAVCGIAVAMLVLFSGMLISGAFLARWCDRVTSENFNQSGGLKIDRSR